jgi:hypothetical protein
MILMALVESLQPGSNNAVLRLSHKRQWDQLPLRPRIGSNLHDFFFFGFAHFFHLFDLVVGELLDLLKRFLLIIF